MNLDGLVISLFKAVIPEGLNRESSLIEQLYRSWISAFAGMTTFYGSANFVTMRREEYILDNLPDKHPVAFQEGQSVDLVIGDRTDLGYKAMIDNSQWGMLYKNEVFQPLRKGQRIKGFVKKMRDDGKIDLCLQKPGPEKVDEVAEKIIGKLKEAGGFVAITDKSPPEIIYSSFGASKKTYKKAIGALYRQRRISIEDNGIKLL